MSCCYRNNNTVYQNYRHVTWHSLSQSGSRWHVDEVWCFFVFFWRFVTSVWKEDAFISWKLSNKYLFVITLGYIAKRSSFTIWWRLMTRTLGAMLISEGGTAELFLRSCPLWLHRAHKHIIKHEELDVLVLIQRICLATRGRFCFMH